MHRRIAALCLTHLLVDFSCALLLFTRFRSSGNWVQLLLYYNFFAFAVQMPLGILADRFAHGSRFAALGCLLVAIALPIRSGIAAAIVAGLGNALFHIGGGYEILSGCPRSAGPLGLFVSPGAFGIYFGTLLGKRALLTLWLPGILLLVAAAVCLLGYALPEELTDRQDTRSGSELLAVLLSCLLVVVLRSYSGSLMLFPWKLGLLSFALTVAIAAGKALGGLFADRFSVRTVIFCSLLPAAVLFCYSRYPLVGLAAVLLFNMTMPITLFLLARAMPERRGFAFGLLTFALFLGFLPSCLSFPALRPAGAWLGGISLISALLLWHASRSRRAHG